MSCGKLGTRNAQSSECLRIFASPWFEDMCSIRFARSTLLLGIAWLKKNAALVELLERWVLKV